jgi:hypothetical protein
VRGFLTEIAAQTWIQEQRAAFEMVLAPIAPEASC